MTRTALRFYCADLLCTGFEFLCALTNHWHGCALMNHNPVWQWAVNVVFESVRPHPKPEPWPVKYVVEPYRAMTTNSGTVTQLQIRPK